jgi:osmoprotectant transport system substrate-binding protein
MKKLFPFFSLILVLVLLITSCNPNSPHGNSDIIIASKDFTEQDILGELLTQQIEAKTHLKVDLRPRLGGTFICHNAILTGKIDAYIEYTGTAFSAILKQATIHDPQIVYDKLRKAYAQKFNLEVMPGLGFEDTFAMIIRGETAQKYQVKTLSEVAKYTPQWRAGFGYEFRERQDGWPGLSQTYGLQFSQSPQIMDLGLIYRALIQKQVDFIAGNSTDAQIARLGLSVLEDDRHYFPPYQPVPIIRQTTLQKYPQLREAIAPLIGRISADEMRHLNNLVEAEMRDVKEVVREFRKAKGL